MSFSLLLASAGSFSNVAPRSLCSNTLLKHGTKRFMGTNLMNLKPSCKVPEPFRLVNNNLNINGYTPNNSLSIFRRAQKGLLERSLPGLGGGRKRRTKEQESDAVLFGHAEKAVVTAVIMNAAVTLGKFGAFLYTGSGTVLSEAIHSLADTMNQALLYIGLQRSMKAPSVEHPYGYGMEKFVWALVSAVGIFFIGSGCTIYHGISTLLTDHAVEGMHVALLTLGGSLLLEGYSFYVAFQACKAGAAHVGMTLKEYLFRGPDPMVLAVLMEDTAALIGVVIAGTCVGLTYVTGNVVWDSVGTIAIGGLLGIIASFLIEKNRSALVGRAIPSAKQMKIVEMMQGDPMIRSLYEVKAVTLGSGVRFMAEVDFNGEQISKEVINTQIGDIGQLHKELDTPEKLETFLVKYGDKIVDQLGKEVDRLEEKIKLTEPEVRYVDIETH